MKKATILFTVLASFSLLFISWRNSKKAESAVHIGLDVCNVLDGDGDIVPLGSGDVVITSSGNGKRSCKASGVDNSTGSAVIWNFANRGLLCLVQGVGPTDDWQNVVSASGQVNLQCRVHPN